MLFDHNKTAGTAQPNHLSKYFAHQQEFNHGVTATFAQFQLIEHTDTTGEMTMERRENDGDLLQYLRWTKRLMKIGINTHGTISVCSSVDSSLWYYRRHKTHFRPKPGKNSCSFDKKLANKRKTKRKGKSRKERRRKEPL
jgi:hypothetical protein